MKRTLVIPCVALLLCGWPTVGRVQPGEIDAPPDSGEEQAPVSGVYVPDSGEALQKIRQAQRLTSAGLWDQAAQLLHEVVARHGAKVLADRVGLYVSVTEYVNEELANWPAEGLAVYRRRYDEVARTAYERASASGDASEMASVARQFWASSYGPRAADEAAELALESGRFTTAIDLWSRLLRFGPRAGLEKANLVPITAKLSVALAWNGQTEQARQLREQLAQDEPDWPNTFGGGQSTLVQWAAAHADSLAGVAAVQAVPGHAPILGGGADRTSIASGGLEFGAELWSNDAHKTTAQRAATNTSLNRGRNPTLILQPVIAERVIYVSSPSGVFALASDSEVTYWHNDEVSTSRMVNVGVAANMVQLFSPTWSDGRVYVDFGSPAARNVYGAQAGAGSGSGIACLDAQGGKLIWKQDIDALPGMRGAIIDSSPLVFGGRVIVVAHVGRSVFNSVVLVALDARTGRVLWQQQVTEANTGGGYAFLRPAPILPAGEGNTVYLCTNVGTVAALAADSGLIRWLRQYERNIPLGRDARGIVNAQARQAAQLDQGLAPTLLWNGRVVVAPADSDDLLVLDAESGAVLSKVNRKSRLYEAQELFGIVDGMLYARGSRVVCWDLEAAREAWAISLVDGKVSNRGFLTREFLYVPTDKYLLRLDLARQGATERFRWPRDDSDGAILLTDQQIIAVSAERIAGFCEWEQAERTSLAAIAANPTNPEPYLVYAHHAYATGHLKLAQEQLTRAVEVAGGFAMLTDPMLKRRVFADALNFARATWQKDPASTLELLRMASLCPPDVEAHVRYRMTLAQYWQDRRDLPQAVRYYQEVLSDPGMRAAGFQIDEENKAPAGPHARRAIDALVQSHGPRVYQAVADRADREYAAALDRGDWAEVERLIHCYPNAERTRAELFRLADHHAAQATYEPAIHWLSYLLRQYPQVMDRNPDEHVRALTRAAGYAMDLRRQFLDRTDLDERTRTTQARRALMQAYQFIGKGRKYDQASVTVAGRQGTLPQIRELFKVEFGRLLGAVPHVAAPLSAGGEVALSTNGRLLKPRLDDGQPFSDDIVLVNVLEGQTWNLQGFRPLRSREPMWTRKYDVGRGAVTNLVTYYDDLAVISQFNRVMGLDPEEGKVRWTVQVPVPNPNQQLNFFASHENFLLAAAYVNSGVIIDLDTGESAAELKLADPINSQPSLDERLISYVTRQGGIRLIVADWRANRVVARLDPPSNDVMWTHVADDGRVLLAGGRTALAAYDIESRRQLWRIGNAAQAIMPTAGYQIRGRMLYTAEMTGGRWRVIARDVTDQGRIVWQQPIEQALGAQVNAAVQLSLSEDELFARSSSEVTVFDADSGKVSYTTMALPGEQIRDMLITQDYLVLLFAQTPRVVAGARQARFQLTARLYDRAPGNGRCEQSLTLETEGYGQAMVCPASPGLILQGANRLFVFQPAAAGIRNPK